MRVPHPLFTQFSRKIPIEESSGICMLFAFLECYCILHVLLLKWITIPRWHFLAEKSTWASYKNKFSKCKWLTLYSLSSSSSPFLPSPFPPLPFFLLLLPPPPPPPLPPPLPSRPLPTAGGWVITKIKLSKEDICLFKSL